MHAMKQKPYQDCIVLNSQFIYQNRLPVDRIFTRELWVYQSFLKYAWNDCDLFCCGDLIVPRNNGRVVNDLSKSRLMEIFSATR